MQVRTYFLLIFVYFRDFTDYIFCSYCKRSQVILTTLLKVYVRGGLFEKSRELLGELEALGYAEEEVHEDFSSNFISLKG